MIQINFVDILNTIRNSILFVASVLAFLYLLSLSDRVRKFVYKQEYLSGEKLVMILFFGFLGILASEYGMKLTGVVVNARDFIAIFAGIFGGPVVGIGAALISGLYRMTGVAWGGWTGTLGYWSAIGCGLGTIGAGFVGAWLSKYKKINIRTIMPRQIWLIAALTFFWEIIHLQVINPLVDPLYSDKTFMWIQKTFFTQLLLPMGLMNALGILLLLFIAHDLIVRKEAEMALDEIRKAEKEIEKIKEV